jgi:hypothetical protein
MPHGSCGVRQTESFEASRRSDQQRALEQKSRRPGRTRIRRPGHTYALKGCERDGRIRGCGDQREARRIWRAVAGRRDGRMPLALHQLAAIRPLDLRVADVCAGARTTVRLGDLTCHVAQVARGGRRVRRQHRDSRGGQHNQNPTPEQTHDASSVVARTASRAKAAPELAQLRCSRGPCRLAWIATTDQPPGARLVRPFAPMNRPGDPGVQAPALRRTRSRRPRADRSADSWGSDLPRMRHRVWARSEC